MTDEPPEMRASDAEREDVAETLREAVAEGRLGMEEFQERLDAAYEARTHGELAPLVRDLPQRGTTAGASGGALSSASHASRRDASARNPAWAERIGGAGTSRWGVGVLGGFGRKGRWTVPRVFTGVAVLGGGELDLREALFEAEEVVIRCFALMGGVGVVVPPEIEVEVRGLGLMGGFDSTADGPGEPGAPRVVITGFAFWGGVGVERKVTRQEKRRLREEKRVRRELRRGERELHARHDLDARRERHERVDLDKRRERRGPDAYRDRDGHSGRGER